MGLTKERSDKQTAVDALERFQEAMAGEAEDAGFKSEEDVIAYCKEIRQELYASLYGNND
jgi:hypothetical protein